MPFGFTLENDEGKYVFDFPAVPVDGDWPNGGNTDLVQVQLNITAADTPPTTTRSAVTLSTAIALTRLRQPAFRSHNTMVRRHISKLDDRFKVGSPEFNPAEIESTDVSDDLLIDSVAKHLLLDWEEVGEEVDGKQQPIDYTPEKGKTLLLQQPELYLAVLSSASDIEEGKEKQKKETVGKLS